MNYQKIAELRRFILRKQGKAYAEKIIPQIREAELTAMKKLTNEQRASLLEGIRIYRDAFRKAMLSGEKV